VKFYPKFADIYSREGYPEIRKSGYPGKKERIK